MTEQWLTPSRLRLAWLCAVLSALAAWPGARSSGFYRDVPLAPQVQAQANDLVTALVALPLLAAALALARRGSDRAELVAIGALAYIAHTYAYYALTLPFGTRLALYVVLIAASAWAAVPGLVAAAGRYGDGEAASGGADNRAPARSRRRRVLAYGLAAAGALLYPMWVAALLVPAGTGSLIPMEQVQLVVGAQVLAVLQLAGATPLGIVAGILLYRGEARGVRLGIAALTCLLLLYLVPLVMTGTMARGGLGSERWVVALFLGSVTAVAASLAALLRSKAPAEIDSPV